MMRKPLQQAFVDKDCPDGFMGKLHKQKSF